MRSVIPSACTPARELARRFLPHCLYARWDPSSLDAARSVAQSQGFDSGALLHVARGEGVAPLGYQAKGAGLLAQAEAFQLVLPVRQVLGHVARDWPVAIPPEVFGQAGDLRPSKTEEKTFTRFVSLAESGDSRSWEDLRSLPGWGARLRFAWRVLIFPSTDYMQRRYRPSHRALIPLYYPYRRVLGLRKALPIARRSSGKG